jgi:hypothetical protein
MSSERDNAGRFRTGQTGNSKGRPRKDSSVDAVVTRAGQEKVVVIENGRRQRRTKLEVNTTQIFNQGAAGDQRAAKMTIDLTRKAEERAEEVTARAPVMTQSDHEIVARVIARLTQIIGEGGNHDEAHI